MFHVYETNKSEIENVERVFFFFFFFTKEKTGNISFYISCIKKEGNSEELCFWIWRSVCAFEQGWHGIRLWA